MRNIRVEKLVINICVGESGDAISKAARVLQQISGQEPVYGKGIACYSHVSWTSPFHHPFLLHPP